MKAAYESFLTLRDCDGTDCVQLSRHEREAMHLIGRVLGEFIANGYALYHGWNNPNMWIVQQGTYYVVIQRVTIYLN